MRDMIPPEDRSIRNIPIPQGHRHHPHPPAPVHQMPPYVRPRRRRNWGRFFVWALIIILVCGAAGAGVAVVFSGATVTVVPKVQEVTASTTIPAAINAPVGTLAFEWLSATQSATTTVPATGTARVSRQATGSVTILSTYSQSQRLIANTRLRAPDGKTYRLVNSVDLPANGSVGAAIRAESPGESYNRSGSTTYTLPGFEGDPRFELFSARSGAVSGGFVGEGPSVAASELEKAKGELERQLQASAGQKLTQSMPEGYTAIPGTFRVEYSDVVQTAGQNKTAVLVQSATAKGAIVRVSDLATALARKSVSGYQGEAIAFKEQGSLTMSASSTDPNADALTLAVSGTTVLVWQFDPNAFKQALIGKDKGQFQAVVDSFAPAVQSATASLRPFWYTNFPANPEKIKIETEQ